MIRKPDQATIDAIAGKALLLEYGDSFVVPVDGDDEYLTRCAEEVRAAIEIQYCTSIGLIGNLPSPDQLEVTEVARHLIVARPGTE